MTETKRLHLNLAATHARLGADYLKVGRKGSDTDLQRSAEAYEQAAASIRAALEAANGHEG